MNFFKHEWLPEDTLDLTKLKVVDFWCGLVLLAFVNMLLARRRENLGFTNAN
jgi:hypothetical protein